MTIEALTRLSKHRVRDWRKPLDLAHNGTHHRQRAERSMLSALCVRARIKLFAERLRLLERPAQPDARRGALIVHRVVRAVQVIDPARDALIVTSEPREFDNVLVEHPRVPRALQFVADDRHAIAQREHRPQDFRRSEDRLNRKPSEHIEPARSVRIVSSLYAKSCSRETRSARP
jgi:hypothetical protein